MSLNLLAIIHVFISEMQFCILLTEAYFVWTARIVQVSVVCTSLVGDGVLSDECSTRFCV